MNFINPIFNLYHSAFPPEERREWTEFEQLLVGNEQFHSQRFEHEGHFCGFINSWEFDNFVYIEHFAIESTMRGHGLGGKILDEFCEKTEKPIILEAEPPETPEALRRIQFYDRHQFKIFSETYTQPPYDRKSAFIPLLLLSNVPTYGIENYENIKNTLYKEVYSVKK